MQIFSNTHYDFIKWRWHAIALSAAVILAGAVMVVQRGLPLGIDFSGGTIAGVPGEKAVQQFGRPDEHSILVRLPQPAGVEEGFSLEKDAKALNDAVKAANLGAFQEIS